jgi:dynein heavy chain 1
LKKQGKDANTIEGRDLQEFEQKILLRSVCETLVPKLIAEDIPLLSNLLQGVFPGSSIPTIK